jgi:hypothetical protein
LNLRAKNNQTTQNIQKKKFEFEEVRKVSKKGQKSGVVLPKPKIVSTKFKGDFQSSKGSHKIYKKPSTHFPSMHAD